MKFKYLGTAAAEGIPSIYCKCPVCENARLRGGREMRTRPGAVIDGTLLMDYSPDIYLQCTHGYMDAAKLRDILITHAHSDHCDMYELLYRSDPCFCLPGEEYTLNVYGNAAAKERFDAANREFRMTHTAFNDIKAFTPFRVQDFTVTPLPADHAYEQEAFIYLIQKDSKCILYGHDTGYLRAGTMEYLQGKRCGLISLDCTMSFAVPDCSRGHMGIDCVSRLRDDLIAQGTADENTTVVCSHFSHNGFNLNGEIVAFEKLCREMARRGMIAAYDGMEIEL